MGVYGLIMAIQDSFFVVSRTEADTFVSYRLDKLYKPIGLLPHNVTQASPDSISVSV
jgi:hypothetical protein